MTGLERMLPALGESRSQPQKWPTVAKDQVGSFQGNGILQIYAQFPPSLPFILLLAL